jgi:hypothetical protein
MASQRVLLFTVAGGLADAVWNDIRRWSDARVAVVSDEWSTDDWPVAIRQEVDQFVTRMSKSAYWPPVLYRSEHVDCWSMGDVFETALVVEHPDHCRRLLTGSHEIIATWVRFPQRIDPDRDAPDETVWLYSRINEAMAAWGAFAENRLVLLVRTVVGGLWTDDEVSQSLRGIPAWWTENEQADSPVRRTPAERK